MVERTLDRRMRDLRERGASLHSGGERPTPSPPPLPRVPHLVEPVSRESAHDRIDTLNVQHEHGGTFKALQQLKPDFWGNPDTIKDLTRLLAMEKRGEGGTLGEKEFLRRARKDMEAALDVEKARSSEASRPRQAKEEPKYVPLKSLADDTSVKGRIEYIKKQSKAGKMITAADMESLGRVMEEVEKNPKAINSVKNLMKTYDQWYKKSYKRAELASEGPRWQRMLLKGTSGAAVLTVAYFAVIASGPGTALAAALGAMYGAKKVHSYLRTLHGNSNISGRVLTSFVATLISGATAGLAAGWIASLLGTGAEGTVVRGNDVQGPGWPVYRGGWI